MTLMLVSTALAAAVLGYVLYPLLREPPAATPAARSGEPGSLPPAQACVACGAVPEPDALFCSSCGRPLTPRA